MRNETCRMRRFSLNGNWHTHASFFFLLAFVPCMDVTIINVSKKLDFHHQQYFVDKNALSLFKASILISQIELEFLDQLDIKIRLYF